MSAREHLAQLAYEFVSAYAALREAIGDAAALADRAVQAARRAWLAVRAGMQVAP